jgi:hypothetical protein
MSADDRPARGFPPPPFDADTPLDERQRIMTAIALKWFGFDAIAIHGVTLDHDRPAAGPQYRSGDVSALIMGEPGEHMLTAIGGLSDGLRKSADEIEAKLKNEREKDE